MEVIAIENITLKYQLANYVKLYNELKEKSSSCVIKLDKSLYEEIDELKKQNHKLKTEHNKLIKVVSDIIDDLAKTIET